MTALRDIPLNLVTGFLGAGKTTLIRHLLAMRPSGERWAVLVNEFGDTGIDGALLAGEGVVIREVPGGCLCCANGVPFRVALNQLLKEARPQRVLVEPSGLGHPLALLGQLAAADFSRGVLDLRATLCVIDPLAALRPEVAGSELFRQQLASADLFVFNHADRATDAGRAALAAWLAEQGLGAVPQVTAERGRISAELLDVPRRAHDWLLLPPPADSGMQHAGAVFAADRVFVHDEVLSLLMALPVERLKAVLHTDRGWLEVNATAALCETANREPAADSRVEVIVARSLGLPDLQVILASVLAGAGE